MGHAASIGTIFCGGLIHIYSVVGVNSVSQTVQFTSNKPLVGFKSTIL